MTLRKALSHPNNQLAQIIAKTAQLQQLERNIMPLLEPALAQNCKIGNYEKGILTLVVENGIWAAKLRFMSSDLLHTLRTSGKLYGLSQIKTKIVPDNTPRKRQVCAKPPAQDMVDIIASSAKSVSHEPLQQALSKLADTLTMKNSNPDNKITD